MHLPLRNTLALLAATTAAGAWSQAEVAPSQPAEPPANIPDKPAPRPTRPRQEAPPPKLDRVEIRSKQDETDQRRVSTAAKIVIGREEIEQYGDDTLSEVLKRLPSVTIGGRPGRGGAIRMRGMGGGYTQILIDGERIPPGFAVDQITPEQVERIEIYRAPTAETGARAIAGTINIVLREPLRQRGDDLRLGAGVERSRVSPNVSWTRNDVLGERGTYNLTLSANRSDQVTATGSETIYTRLATGATDLWQRHASQQQSVRDSLSFNSRVQWQLGQGDQFSLQPFAVFNQGHSQTQGALQQFIGALPAPYATSASGGSGDSALARLMFFGRKRLGDATRLELRGSVGTFRSTTDSGIDEFSDTGALVLDQHTHTTINDRSWNGTLKLSHLWAERHSLVGGLEASGVQRVENSITLLNGTPAIPDFGGDLRASVRRVAAYVQDEWDPSPAWSAYAGLRWESIVTHSESIGAPVSNKGSVLTPLLHAVWRIDPPRRDQVRFSLTRSYRAPTLQNIAALPSLSTLYPAPGANTAASHDRAGNPALRPEVARGIDIAYEHYLPTSGVLSVSVFRRSIQDLIRNVTALEAVPWAAVPRWVSRPQNIGDAMSQGIEFDGKFRLDDVVADALPVQVRGNMAVYHSRVSGVPGPDNRIDGQPRASLNLGGDYRLRSLPLQVGGNFHWIPPYAVQQTEDQRQAFEIKRVADAFVAYSFNPTTKLRLGLGNLVPRNYVTTNTIIAGRQAQTVVATGPTSRVVSLRLEVKL